MRTFRAQRYTSPLKDGLLTVEICWMEWRIGAVSSELTVFKVRELDVRCWWAAQLAEQPRSQWSSEHHEKDLRESCVRIGSGDCTGKQFWFVHKRCYLLTIQYIITIINRETISFKLNFFWGFLGRVAAAQGKPRHQWGISVCQGLPWKFRPGDSDSRGTGFPWVTMDSLSNPWRNYAPQSLVTMYCFNSAAWLQLNPEHNSKFEHGKQCFPMELLEHRTLFLSPARVGKCGLGSDYMYMRCVTYLIPL